MRFSEAKVTLSGEILENVLYFLKTGERSRIKAPPFLCEGFCLWASMMALNFQEEDFSFFNEDEGYKSKLRDDDIKSNLLKTKKGKSLTENQIDELIKENYLKDIRNCFYHGNFEVENQEGIKCFVLFPKHAHNITQYPIIIHYKSIYGALQKKYFDEKQSKEEDGASLKELHEALSVAYVEMAKFFHSSKNTDFIMKDVILKGHLFIDQYFDSLLNVVYEQNDIMPLLKNYPEKGEKMCVLRNSVAHGQTLSEKGKMKFVDVDQKRNTKKEVSMSMMGYTLEMMQINMLSLLEKSKILESDIDKRSGMVKKDLTDEQALALKWKTRKLQNFVIKTLEGIEIQQEELKAKEEKQMQEKESQEKERQVKVNQDRQDIEKANQEKGLSDNQNQENQENQEIKEEQENEKE